MQNSIVVDANVLLAALFKGALTRELLFDTRFKLYAPEHLVLEIQRLLKRDLSIQRRTGLSGKALEEVFYFLTQKIEMHPESTYSPHIKEALSLAPHFEDAPYLALALALHVPIWSNDKGIHAQSKVKVYTTKKLLLALDTISS